MEFEYSSSWEGNYLEIEDEFEYRFSTIHLEFLLLGLRFPNCGRLLSTYRFNVRFFFLGTFEGCCEFFSPLMVKTSGEFFIDL